MEPPAQDASTEGSSAQDAGPGEKGPTKLVALPSPKRPRDPYAEHEQRNIDVAEAIVASAKANVEAVEVSRESAAATMEAASAMNAMQAHFAEQRAMDRLRLINGLLCAWTHGKPGRIDKQTIADAIASVDDLFSMAELTPAVAMETQIASGENHESRP